MFGDEAITREIMGHVPRWLAVAFYVGAVVACGATAVVVGRRVWQCRLARRPSEVATAGTWHRIVRGLRYLAFHEQLRRDRFAGWAHLLMFYGFVILFAGTCLVFLEHDTPLHFYYGWFYQWASLVIDLGGVAFLIGLLMFLGRRASSGSQRILRGWRVTSLSALLLAIGVSGFLLEGARIAVDLPPHETYSVAGYGIALLLRAAGIGGETAVRWQQWLWGGHAAACVAFFGLVPWGVFRHMVFGLASATATGGKPLSRLPVAPLGPELAPGATTWRQFSRNDLLEADACTTCGRCNEACPAAAAGKPLQPRDVVLELRDSRGTWSAADPQPLAVSDEVLWSCTTCAACNQACPVGIDVYGKIVELRRGRVERGGVPEAAAAVFEHVADRWNPFGRPDIERMAWAQGINVRVADPDEPIELLYWVGCAGSFTPEGRAVAQAMVRILNRLGINYRVLGRSERCTGDPARRMGEEGLFRECATHNLRTLRAHHVQRLITHCPHCFNTFRNEYPDVDDSAAPWSVQHHSEFLAEQIAEGRLCAASMPGDAVTFHDPCYLGRGNSVFAEPRSILKRMDLPLVEMPRYGEHSFCCGAGGGSMWLDVRGAERIETKRYDEAAGTGAGIIATACPFCKTMLDAARQARDASSTQPLRVLDVAELVAAAEGC